MFMKVPMFAACVERSDEERGNYNRKEKTRIGVKKCGLNKTMWLVIS
jgi:hypothetical protein